MHTHIFSPRRGFILAASLSAALLSQSAFAGAQVSGEAAVAKVNVQAVTNLLGIVTPAINTTLADTGSLTSDTDMRDASMLSGSVASLLSGETLHAVTAAAPDEVVSQASVSGVGLNLAGNTIGAGFVFAHASAPTGGSAVGSSEIEGLLVNGSPVTVTGAANQVIPLLGGKVVLNEQQLNSDGSMVVNAIHVTIFGVADVVIVSASAGATGSGGSSLLPLFGVTAPIMHMSPAPRRASPNGEMCVESKRLSEIV